MTKETTGHTQFFSKNKVHSYPEGLRHYVQEDALLSETKTIQNVLVALVEIKGPDTQSSERGRGAQETLDIARAFKDWSKEKLPNLSNRHDLEDFIDSLEREIHYAPSCPVILSS